LALYKLVLTYLVTCSYEDLYYLAIIVVVVVVVVVVVGVVVLVVVVSMVFVRWDWFGQVDGRQQSVPDWSLFQQTHS